MLCLKLKKQLLQPPRGLELCWECQVLLLTLYQPRRMALRGIDFGQSIHILARGKKFSNKVSLKGIPWRQRAVCQPCCTLWPHFREPESVETLVLQAGWFQQSKTRVGIYFLLSPRLGCLGIFQVITKSVKLQGSVWFKCATERVHVGSLFFFFLEL